MPRVTTLFEGKNTGVLTNPRETPDPINPGRHYTKQRISTTQLTPDHRIPNSWWNTFTNHEFDKVLPNAAGVFNIARNAGQNKTGHIINLPAHPFIPAPTKSDVIRNGVAHQIIKNARPVLMYQRTNVLDAPGHVGPPTHVKNCAYGKVRDPNTNSWRCVKNPNHHRVNMNDD
jgi:hypothetical protein